MEGSQQQQAINMVLRVWEMLDAHDTARRAYKRLLARPTMVEVAKNVICLLLWLEMAMGIKLLLQQVSRMEMNRDTKLSLLIKEADGLYSYLLDGDGPDALPEALVRNIPTIVSMCGGSGGRLVDFGFFKFHRELVARGVAVIRDTVAALVFNDDLHAMLRRFEDDLDESLKTTAAPAPAPAPELMEVFVPLSRTPPEDSRTALLAISEAKTESGEPCAHGVTAQGIIDHFERVYGFPGYIERVEIEEQPCAADQQPKHGIVVFKSPENRKEAMFHETSHFFRIQSNDIWLQSYMPPF